MTKTNSSKIAADIYSYMKEGCRGSVTKIDIVKNTLILILQDFFDEKSKAKPDLYLLEAFAGDMLYVVNTPEEIKKIDDKLAYVLDIAADITFPYQEGSKKNDLSEYNNLINELRDYLSSQN